MPFGLLITLRTCTCYSSFLNCRDYRTVEKECQPRSADLRIFLRKKQKNERKPANCSNPRGWFMLSLS